jgi:hypothetical protein
MRFDRRFGAAIAIKQRIHRRGRRDEVISRAAEQFGRH